MDARNKSGHDGEGVRAAADRRRAGDAAHPDRNHANFGTGTLSDRENLKKFSSKGLTEEKMVYNGCREAVPWGRLSAFLRRRAAGAEKNPAGGDGRGASAVSRAQSGARTAPALTRAGGRGRARRIRAQKGSRRRRGRTGAERNATEEGYAGTEPQSFGGGMANMTCHDTMQGVFHEPPCLRRGWAPSAASRAIRRANRAGARRARAGAGAQARNARKKGPAAPGSRAAGEGSGVERNEREEQHAQCRRTRLRRGRQDAGNLPACGRGGTKERLRSKKPSPPGRGLGEGPLPRQRKRRAKPRQPPVTPRGPHPTSPAGGGGDERRSFHASGGGEDRSKRRSGKKGQNSCPKRLWRMRRPHVDHDIA